MNDLALAPTSAGPVPTAPGRGPTAAPEARGFDRVLSRAGAAIEARRPVGRHQPDGDTDGERTQEAEQADRAEAEDGADHRTSSAAALAATAPPTPVDQRGDPAPRVADAGLGVTAAGPRAAEALAPAVDPGIDGAGPTGELPPAGALGGTPLAAGAPGGATPPDGRSAPADPSVVVASPTPDPTTVTGPPAPAAADAPGATPAGADAALPEAGPVAPESALDPAAAGPGDRVDGAPPRAGGTSGPGPDPQADRPGAGGEGGAAQGRSLPDATGPLAEPTPPRDLAAPAPLDGLSAPTTLDPAAGPRPATPLAPLSAPATAAAPAPPPEPAQQVAQALGTLRHLTDGSQQIEVRLHPEELGEVRIEVTATGGQLRINLVAERAETRDRLQADLGQLAARLAESGMPASSLDVGTRSDGRAADPGDRRPALAGGDRFRRAGGALDPTPTVSNRPAGAGRLDLIL